MNLHSNSHRNSATLGYIPQFTEVITQRSDFTYIVIHPCESTFILVLKYHLRRIDRYIALCDFFWALSGDWPHRSGNPFQAVGTAFFVKPSSFFLRLIFSSPTHSLCEAGCKKSAARSWTFCTSLSEFLPVKRKLFAALLISVVLFHTC